MTGDWAEAGRDRPGEWAAAWWSSSGEDSYGPTDKRFAWASVTKVVVALAAWVAIEEGVLDEASSAGPQQATIRHLLAHSSGLSFDSDHVLAAPGTRRIYSNRGFEILAAELEAASGMTWVDYAREAVLEPLGMSGTELGGSAAAGARGPVSDMLVLGRELLFPTLVAAETVARATTVVFPGLAGVLPGFGPQNPNDWGLGVEIRGTKSPHWTGRENSPRTFGHFGRAGSFLWVDPIAGVCTATAGREDFGPWAAQAWPALSDAVLRAAR